VDEVGLGKVLQQARQAAGLTQQDLCQKSGLSYSTLAKIERGAIKSPSIFTIASLAQALGRNLDDLLGGVAGLKTQPEPKKTSKTGIKFVYFDVNGCLVRFFHRAFSELAHDTGAPSDLIETTFWHYNDAVCRGEMTLTDFNIKLAQALHVDSLDWQEYYLRAVDPIAEMQGVVTWTVQHYRAGLLTNIMPGFIEAMQTSGLIPAVDYHAIVDSSEIGAIKPEQKIYQIAAGLTGVNENEILFVDDSRTNLMAAEKLGWKVLWFDDYRPDESAKRIRSALEY
jgi:FMN phosphatase YigB (HAD superfamily)/DNA-binding XRE family transcriptional regulator